MLQDVTQEIMGGMSTFCNLIIDVCHGSQGQRHRSEFLPTLTHLTGIFVLTFISKMPRLWFVQSTCHKVETYQSAGATRRSTKVPYFLCAFPFQASSLMWSLKEEVPSLVGALLHVGQMSKAFFFPPWEQCGGFCALCQLILFY